MEPITVLMTGAGAPGAFGIIQCLRNNGERPMRIVGVDMNDHAGCRDLVDVFRVVPPAASDDFVSSIKQVALEEGVKAIVPIVTRELPRFARSKAEFAECGIAVGVLDEQTLDIVNDKVALFDYAKAHGFTMPEYLVVRSLPELKGALEEMRCDIRPVFIKSAQGNGSRGVRFIDPNRSKYDLFMNEKPDSACMTKEAVLEAFSERPHMPTLMVMESLPGVEYSADILADHGEVKYIAVRKSPVVRSSITMESVIVENSTIEELCTGLARELGLHGNIGFDFKSDAEGTPRLLEINPRLTATVVLNAVAGINFPYLGIKQLLGEDLPECSLSYGTMLRRRYEESYYDKDGNAMRPFAS